ncbi:oxidoreductase [Sulfitobacter sp. SK012]|uniref:Gfo/Idh/MocA family protein n=1 Tax=Sulfitobacter sp. SK012 TaxID=1389005 RepID=UPI000E0C064F|nr:Gfo/Idh/MocA family oxidoreductase [Sulfitobacter sp. SK012]AXI48815.1 oxidoreductase [Sulfitobacter sp. SK012]
MTVLRWGILGAANFARHYMGPAIHAAKGASLDALATSDPAKAANFSAFAPGLRVHDSYEALLNDPQIDAVYIPLPNHMHVEWTLKALEAGKHVLCEKPITMQADQFDQLIAARDASGLLAAEAYMIVHHPQMLRAREIVQSGALGQLGHVQASFSFFNDDQENIRNQADLGGGGLPDIGVYTFGAARFVTGQEPLSVPYARIDYTNGVDTFVQMAADFDGFSYGATVAIRLFKQQELTFHGEKGLLRLSCPFNAGVLDQAELHLETDDTTITTERFAGVNQYVLQVEAFGRAAQGHEVYGCPLEFSRGTQAMIDMTYAAGGRG